MQALSKCQSLASSWEASQQRSSSSSSNRPIRSWHFDWQRTITCHIHHPDSLPECIVPVLPCMLSCSCVGLPLCCADAAPHCSSEGWFPWWHHMPFVVQEQQWRCHVQGVCKGLCCEKQRAVGRGLQQELRHRADHSVLLQYFGVDCSLGVPCTHHNNHNNHNQDTQLQHNQQGMHRLPDPAHLRH